MLILRQLVVRIKFPVRAVGTEDQHAVPVRLEIGAPPLGAVVAVSALETLEHDQDMLLRVIAQTTSFWPA
jgi:glucose dehydrogenase